MTRDDLELRYDGPIPPAMLEQARRSNVNPDFVRRLELESIVLKAEAEVSRTVAQQKIARERGHKIRLKFLEIDRVYWQQRLSLASALLEREQFDD